MKPLENQGKSYAKTTRIFTSSERIYHALTSLEGLAGWWTPQVEGSGDSGGHLRFEFQGLPEFIVMRVDEAKRPDVVRWTCREHSKLPEWSDTKLNFEISEMGFDQCELRFRHEGLTPNLECYEHCEIGWDHFLNSMKQYVESGRGEPYGDGWNVARCAGAE